MATGWLSRLQKMINTIRNCASPCAGISLAEYNFKKAILPFREVLWAEIRRMTKAIFSGGVFFLYKASAVCYEKSNEVTIKRTAKKQSEWFIL